MKKIPLDGSNWTEKEDFYVSFLSSVGAPDWHGHNLDALWDSIVGGQINKVKPPFTVAIRGKEAWSTQLTEFMEQVETIFLEAKAEGVNVELKFSSNASF